MSIVDAVKHNFPNVKIIEKQSSTLMKVIGFLLFWNKPFMKSFCTTLGNTIYIPSVDWINKNPTMLVHELTHVIDYNRDKVAYTLLYLLPYPFLFRANFEKKAYFVELYAANKLKQLDMSASWKSMVDDYFKTSTYFWMNPKESYDVPTELVPDAELKTMIDTIMQEYMMSQ